MTEGPIAVAKSLGDQAITAVGDPRVYGTLMHHGVGGLPLLTSWRDERRAVTEARAQAAAAFEAVLHAPPAMELIGIDVTDAALNALRRLALRSIPWLAPERDAIAAAIGAVQPRTLVMASDQHRLGRLATALAAERGLETVVVQHGLPQTRIGMIPVVAGCLAVWSRDSYEWFVREGTPSAKLCVTGDPRMEMHRRVTERAERSILLLALSPTDETVNRAVVRLALGMRQVWPQAPRLVVKLHPGHRDWKWVSDEVGTQQGVSVLHREPLEPLLQQALATVVLRSTVALEALAFGSPIISVCVPGGVSTADHELKSMRIPVAASPQELRSIVQSMLDEHHRHNYFNERSAEITSLLGEIEGAAARVAALARGIGCPGASAHPM
ncbi:MAG: hypothetical protein M3406_16320 [Chloroflexota bacterium]|nr:hypothetical protein [Chloroflexota bacterium]